MADIKRIAVVGSGLMGHAIALDFALAGFWVKMQDRDDASVERGFEMVRADFDRMVKLKTTTRAKANAALKMMSRHTVLEEAVGDADVVVEAVFENLEVKQEMFRKLDAAASKKAILASNTSSFMPSQLAKMTSRPDKVLVAHYFNPAHLIPLVELVRSPETSDATVETMRGLYTVMGKKPIVVEKEVIGFIVNRMQIALQREALWLLDNGVASAEDIDTGLKSSAGRRWAVAGPFEVMDLAGLDTLVDASKAMLPHISNSREVSKSLTDAVKRGNLGTKTGKGFHTWTRESVEAVKQRIAEALVELERWSKEESGKRGATK